MSSTGSYSSGGMPKNPTFSTLKISAGGTFDLYNTADQTTNYERLRADYSGNVARLFTQYGGSGSIRSLRVGIAASAAGLPSTGIEFFNGTITVGNFLGSTNSTAVPVQLGYVSFTSAVASQTAVSVNPAINQSGTAGATILNIDPTVTATGSGTYLIQRWGWGGSEVARMNNSGVLYSNFLSAISNIGLAASIGAANDVTLCRDAADTLALRRGTSAQTFRVYNTYTDASNYERLGIAWSSNIAIISTDAAGTGTVRALRLNGATLSLLTGGTLRWNVNGSGHFLAEADNTYDIGASGANRPRWIYTVGLSGTYLRNVPTVVGSLVAAAAGNAGQRAYVTDSTVAMAGNFGAIVVGGGANSVPVISDGANWRIG